MIITRTKFFLSIILLLITPLVVPKMVWLLQSKKTMGIFSFEGKGNALDQWRSSYSVIYFMVGKDTIWFNGPGGLRLREDAIVPVRYLPSSPDNAKLDSFKSIWGATAVYGGIPLLILLVIFLHPEIVPYRSKVRVMLNKPFLKLV